MTDIPAELASGYMVFCDGLEAAGQVDHARRGRVIAGHLIETLDALDAERSARVALQERIARMEKIILTRRVPT